MLQNFNNFAKISSGKLLVIHENINLIKLVTYCIFNEENILLWRLDGPIMQYICCVLFVFVCVFVFVHIIRINDSRRAGKRTKRRTQKKKRRTRQRRTQTKTFALVLALQFRQWLLERGSRHSFLLSNSRFNYVYCSERRVLSRVLQLTVKALIKNTLDCVITQK